MRAKIKPSQKSLVHPYFGKINLYRNGVYNYSVLESVQTTAFYYALINTTNIVALNNRQRVSESKSKSITALSSMHTVRQGEEGKAVSLSLIENFMHMTSDYASEMHVDDFKVKFREGKVMINCDDTPIVLRDDKALSLLRSAGRRVMNKPLDELLQDLEWLWKNEKGASLD